MPPFICAAQGTEGLTQINTELLFNTSFRLPQCAGDAGLISCVRKIPWRRKWQPTPVFLPGKSHGQKSLAGYCPWGHKESDATEVT